MLATHGHEWVDSLGGWLTCHNTQVRTGAGPSSTEVSDVARAGCSSSSASPSAVGIARALLSVAAAEAVSL